MTSAGTIAEIARVLEVVRRSIKGWPTPSIETGGRSPEQVAAAILGLLDIPKSVDRVESGSQPRLPATATTEPLPHVCPWPILAFLGLGFFLIGTVVGSFLNVCIYRIPWQKSVDLARVAVPDCLGAIAARDNIPIVSWIALRGECRCCGAPIAVRYPLVEALVGLLFLGAYFVDVIAGPRGAWGQIPAFQLVGGRLPCAVSGACWSPPRSSTTT